jgi:hypothetical protein
MLSCIQAFELTLDIDRLIKEVDYDRWGSMMGLAWQHMKSLTCSAFHTRHTRLAGFPCKHNPDYQQKQAVPMTKQLMGGCLCAGWSATLCRSGFLDYKEFKTIMT